MNDLISTNIKMLKTEFLNMKNLSAVFIFTIILGISCTAYSQSKDSKQSSVKDLTSQNKAGQNVKQEVNIPDFKIISSTNSYIEIEFNPQYVAAGPSSKNNSGTVFSFKNEIINGDKPGSPDVRTRSFPVFLPSEINNVQILDAKYTDITGLEIRPIPFLEKGSNQKNKQDASIPHEVYRKDEKYYSYNKFYPESPAILSKIGIFREKYYSNLLITPVEYNPVSGQVRKYTYLRVRINFTAAPKMMTRSLSSAEKEFITGITLNYSEAMNWSTGK